jgi:hypothetical protein
MDYSAKLKVKGRSATVFYEEGARRLELGFELSGVQEFDWVATEESIREWTVPTGVAIPARMYAPRFSAGEILDFFGIRPRSHHHWIPSNDMRCKAVCAI